ncbi:MAG: guanylate kinase [Holosporales bacterium]|jgi:guanylate kinase|nr:guanylate kinase [Holosporales bacterium]
MTDKTLLVFSGPSGAGKTTLIRYVLHMFKDQIGITISCTTRSSRDREVDGIDYHFITQEKFSTLVKKEEFLEHTECYGNRYGTLKRSVNELLQDKGVCIMDVDYIGAASILSGNFEPQLKKVGVLILPPSISSLKKRLIGRKSEAPESLETRLKKSFDSPKIATYDHILINDTLENSKAIILQIVKPYLLV